LREINVRLRLALVCEPECNHHSHQGATVMKKVPLVFAFILTAMPFSSQAHAQNYPWCAQYTGSGLGGAMNCGFVSFGSADFA
jgi:hypothetical protein